MRRTNCLPIALLIAACIAQAGVAPGARAADLSAAAAAVTRGDGANALKLYLQAAERDDPTAQFELGRLLDGTRPALAGVAKDDAQAIAWYRKAAEREHPPAQIALSNALLYGRGGLARDAKSSFAWMSRAAEKGDAEAQWSLARKFDRGEGVARDAEKALQWATRSAEQGNASAQVDVALRMRGKPGVAYSEAALGWLRRAAAQGHSVAMQMLGLIHATEEPADFALAYFWLQLAELRGMGLVGETAQRSFQALQLARSRLSAEELEQTTRALRDWRPQPERPAGT